MIALLRGNLLSRETNHGIIDVNGVGYLVFATERNLGVWADVDDVVEVHVHTQVREDDISLYGFSSLHERIAFQTLTKVNKIGPRVALATLNTLPLPELRRAVETDDISTLSRIPGVGRKTAQRLALELKGKLPAVFSVQTSGEAARTPVPQASQSDGLALALQRLGYSRAEIVRVREALVRAEVPEDAPLAEQLRAALRLLYRPA